MDGTEIFIIVAAVIIVIIVIARKALKISKAQQAHSHMVNTLVAGYNDSITYIKNRGVTVSKEYTYYIESGVPFVRIVIDDVSKWVHVFQFNKGNTTRMHFSIIEYCDIVKDTDSATPAVQSAVSGAMLAGATGAIIGALAAKDTVNVNSLAIEITLDDLNIPTLIIPLYSYGSGSYQNAVTFANTVTNGINYIIRHNGLT